jgi:hypothetical protein
MLHTGERLALEGETVCLVLEKNVGGQAAGMTATELRTLLISFAEDANTLALALREYVENTAVSPSSSAPAPLRGAGGGAQHGQDFLIRA